MFFLDIGIAIVILSAEYNFCDCTQCGYNKLQM